MMTELAEQGKWIAESGTEALDTASATASESRRALLPIDMLCDSSVFAEPNAFYYYFRRQLEN